MSLLSETPGRICVETAGATSTEIIHSQRLCWASVYISRDFTIFLFILLLFFLFLFV